MNTNEPKGFDESTLVEVNSDTSDENTEYEILPSELDDTHLGPSADTANLSTVLEENDSRKQLKAALAETNAFFPKAKKPNQ